MVFAVEAMPTEERVILALSLLREANVKINEYALSELWGIIRVRLNFSEKLVARSEFPEERVKLIFFFTKKVLAGARANKTQAPSFWQRK